MNYWLDPITKGKYPENLCKEASDYLDFVTAEEMGIINQKIDFLGLNIYQAQYT